MAMYETPLTSTAGIRYGPPDRPALVLDLLAPAPPPESPLPTVIRVSGAGWVEENRAGYTASRTGIRFLAAAGFLAAAISVRLSWQAPFPAQLHDVKAAVRWLRAHAGQYPIDPDRIGIMGDSAGGHLAARSCRDLHRIDAFTQLFGGRLGERAELMRLASPIRHVHPGAPPFLIIHGTDDETVPFEQGQRLHHALQRAGADSTFVPVHGGHHNLREEPDLPYSGEIWDAVTEQTVEFFRCRLGEPSA